MSFTLRNIRSSVTVVLFLVCLLSSTVNGYNFLCLDNCVCDTGAQLIDCSRQIRRVPPAIDTEEHPTHGFETLSLRDTCLSEFNYNHQQLHEKLPDLKFVDLSTNLLSCDDIEDIKQKLDNRIQVLHSCGHHDPTIITRCNPENEDGVQLDGDCNLQCKVGLYWRTVKRYAERAFHITEEQWNKHKDKLGFSTIEKWIGENINR